MPQEKFSQGATPEDLEKINRVIISPQEVKDNQEFLVREIANDSELPNFNTDKMLAKIQTEWLDDLPQGKKDLIAQHIDLDFVKKAIFSYDYKELVLLVLLLNQLAKEFYTIRPFSWQDDELAFDEEEREEYNKNRYGLSDKFYEMKEIVLAKACQLAAFEAPEHSYGLDEDRRINVLYFDLPGYGQFSFHMPYIKQADRKNPNLAILYRKLDLPKYHGDWKQRNKISVSPMTTGKVKEIVKTGEHPISLEEIKQYLDEREEINPKKAHDLYFRAMAHPDFYENKEKISELLFKHAPTIPGALSDAYVEGFDLPYKFFSKRIKKRKPWMDYLSPTYYDIIYYMEELDALIDYAQKNQPDKGAEEGTFYDPNELAQEYMEVETDMELVKEKLNQIFKPALLFYLDDDDYYAPSRIKIYKKLDGLLERLGKNLDDFLPEDAINDYGWLNRNK